MRRRVWARALVWDVYPGAGTAIQTAIDSAGVGDMIYVHVGTYVENVDVWKRVTLIGDGVGTAATNVYMDIDKY
ncbi:MAG: hypothetical protein C4B59_09130 [Candidatus Methanogaster sp.]|uniref:Uncharacterized protein n=1 Tax=Candidatus Methanogaster sp. TaxID=3386292 RepID=A0AC61L2J9_9EURY|nr:MAG: hypothetical protein C4B59_09130 [ANME-2 cluster archaeon]